MGAMGIVRRSRATTRSWRLVPLLVAVLVASCVPDGSPPPVLDPGPDGELRWLTAVRGKDAGVYDDAGRQVLLRGVNFNHLGDYFQATRTCRRSRASTRTTGPTPRRRATTSSAS